MIIHRGAGVLTLLSPIIAVLLLMWLWPDPTVATGNTSLSQVLLGFGIGAAINVVVGVALNRGPRAPDGRARHHFFFVPMQWPSLVIVVAYAAVALLR